MGTTKSICLLGSHGTDSVDYSPPLMALSCPCTYYQEPGSSGPSSMIPRGSKGLQGEVRNSFSGPRFSLSGCHSSATSISVLPGGSPSTLPRGGRLPSTLSLHRGEYQSVTFKGDFLSVRLLWKQMGAWGGACRQFSRE